MGAPQIIVIALFALSLGVAIAEHGKEKKYKFNAMLVVLQEAVVTALLIWGGFFNG
jgi:uncharacterized membrane protein YoaK (UPF0700 family)